MLNQELLHTVIDNFCPVHSDVIDLYTNVRVTLEEMLALGDISDKNTKITFPPSAASTFLYKALTH